MVNVDEYIKRLLNDLGKDQESEYRAYKELEENVTRASEPDIGDAG